MSKYNLSRLSVVEDLWLVISNSITTPSFFLSSLFSIAVIATHLNDSSTGLIAFMLSRFSDHKVVQLLADEIVRFLGMIAFVPVLINSPRVSLLAVWLMIPSMVMLMPPQHQLVYALCATIVHVYLHVKLRASRVACVAAVAALIGLLYAERSPVLHPNTAATLGINERTFAPSINAL